MYMYVRMYKHTYVAMSRIYAYVALGMGRDASLIQHINNVLQ